MTKTIQELKLLAKEKAFDVYVYEGEFSHHETEYTLTESSIFELLQAQVPLQGELVAWRQTVHVEEVGIKSIKYLYNDEKIMVDDEPLYLATPSTEALQQDKAEMIEYAENIVVALDAIMLFGTDIKIAKEFAKVALETKKPKCMEGMMN